MARQLGLTALCFALLWGLAVGSASGRDPDGRYATAPYHQWFESQHNSRGGSCCADADGHEYDGQYRLNQDGSVTVEWQGKPHTIDAWKVLMDSKNPTGHAVWWYLIGPRGDLNDYCFAPGSLT